MKVDWCEVYELKCLWTFVAKLSEQRRIIALDIWRDFSDGKVTNFGQASGEGKLTILILHVLLPVQNELKLHGFCSPPSPPHTYTSCTNVVMEDCWMDPLSLV